MNRNRGLIYLLILLTALGTDHWLRAHQSPLRKHGSPEEVRAFFDSIMKAAEDARFISREDIPAVIAPAEHGDEKACYRLWAHYLQNGPMEECPKWAEAADRLRHPFSFHNLTQPAIQPPLKAARGVPQWTYIPGMHSNPK